MPRGGVRPASGPVDGGTLVRVRIANYSSVLGAVPATSLALRCRFGLGAALSADPSSDPADEFTVPAAHWHERSARGAAEDAPANDALEAAGMECTAPSHAAVGAEPVMLQISANAQQFHDAGTFTFYRAPSWASATPRSGPVGGDALVTIRGHPLLGGDSYACRVGGRVVAGSFARDPERVQCRTPPLDTTGPTERPLELSLNAQQFGPLSDANGSFHAYSSPDEAHAAPATGPANGGTVVEVRVTGDGFGGGNETSSNQSCRCVFGYAERRAADGMLLEGAGVVAGTFAGEAAVRCVAPPAELAGAADFLEPLRRPHGRLHVLGAALVSAAISPALEPERRWRGAWPSAGRPAASEPNVTVPLGAPPAGTARGSPVDGAARLSGLGGECGSLLVVPLRGASGRSRAEWLEQTMLVRATPPRPSWGGGGRVAAMGGFSWSYGELPRPGARAVVGASGAGLGLIVRLAPQMDGEVAWQVWRAGSLVLGDDLPANERDMLKEATWRRLWIRLDERGMHLRLGNTTLIEADSPHGQAPPRASALFPASCRSAALLHRPCSPPSPSLLRCCPRPGLPVSTSPPSSAQAATFTRATSAQQAAGASRGARAVSPPPNLRTAPGC